MAPVSVRYITDDVGAAVAFYAERLAFNVETRPGPGFAMLSRGDLRLLLTRPGAGGQDSRCPMAVVPSRGLESHPDRGLRPRPRGPVVARGWASFRNDISTRRGGSEILLEDPSGNPIELFQPADA